MVPTKPTVLCIQKRQGRLEETARVLADAGYDVIGTACSDCAVDFLATRPVDGVMIDLFLRDPAADAVRDDIRRLAPGVPVIVFHGGHLLQLEVEILSAWIHRAQREATHPQADDFERALTEHSAAELEPALR
jgi:DNA-binding NtrC family response regulator